MLALLQKFITLGLFGIGAGWFFVFREHGLALALAGLPLLLLAYSFVIGLELLLVRWVGSGAASLAPTGRELMAAWWGEICAAPPVFCWRQPFRHQAYADQVSAQGLLPGRRGVIFVHGFFCNRGFWNPWLARLQGSGTPFMALNLAPVYASIDDYAPQIEAAVAQLQQLTGRPPLLVCHSMGGLAVRAWLAQQPSAEPVHHIVTIGTPHGGTWLARFGLGTNVRQMQIASAWQKKLDQALTPAHRRRFTCWYSCSDNIVFPAYLATLEGAEKRLLRGVAHVQMAFVPAVIDQTLALLEPEQA